MNEEDEVLMVKTCETTTKDETWNTPDDQTLFKRTKMKCKSCSLEPSAWCAFRACEQTVLHRCVL